MAEIRAELQIWTQKTHATQKEVQSIVGRVYHAASCIQSGCLFFSRMLAYMKTMPRTGKVPVDHIILKDIQWWYTYMDSYNGVSINDQSQMGKTGESILL